MAPQGGATATPPYSPFGKFSSKKKYKTWGWKSPILVKFRSKIENFNYNVCNCLHSAAWLFFQMWCYFVCNITCSVLSSTASWVKEVRGRKLQLSDRQLQTSDTGNYRWLKCFDIGGRVAGKTECAVWNGCQINVLVNALRNRLQFLTRSWSKPCSGLSTVHW